VGLLAALAGLVVAFYATAGAVLLVGAILTLLGMTRIYWPELWNRLVMLGVIQMKGSLAEFLDQMSPVDQGFAMILVAAVFVVCGLGMLWLGRYLLRGLRFLFSLVFDWLRRSAQSVQRKLRRDSREVSRPAAVAVLPHNR
jgi:hypothetical protein